MQSQPTIDKAYLEQVRSLLVKTYDISNEMIESKLRKFTTLVTTKYPDAHDVAWGETVAGIRNRKRA